MWHKFSQEKSTINIPIPPELKNILLVIKRNGGIGYLVGGIVRDFMFNKIHHTNIHPKDYDVEVYNILPDKLVQILSKFGDVNEVGKSFGVLKLSAGGEEYDFSLPRIDSKSGSKHTDFDVQVNPNLTPLQAASRRDVTINSMLFDPLNNTLIDPYNGEEDIKNKTLRHTSEAFSEDPLRVLRLMSIGSRFGLKIAPETAELANSIRHQYKHLPKERVEGEFKKLVQKGIEPGRALDYLYQTGWSENFPEVNVLRGVPQEFSFHPEGWGIKVVSPDLLGASMAKAQSINFLTRELILNSLANPTRAKSGYITSSAKLHVKSFNLLRNLKSTFGTRISNFVFFPFINSPTSIAPTKGFVWSRSASTQNAAKVIGIVFQIPCASVLAIMQPSVNHLEVINGIIQSVAIYVVDVLRAEQFSTQMKGHNISVQKHASTDSGNGNFSISPSVINPKFSIVNDDIIFYFYLSGVGDVDFHNNNIGDVQDHYLVSLGDVATHTAHVMNEAARIATENNLTPEEREVLVYAALCHDFAKPATTKTIVKKGVPRITSHGHEEAGGPMARHFLESIGVNKKIIDQVVPLVENHLNHVHMSHMSNPDSFIRQLAERLHPSNIKMLEHLIEADHSGRPPLEKMLPEEAKAMSERAKSHNVYTEKHPDLLQGRDLMPYTDGKGGPIIGQILKEHRNDILKNKLTTRSEALSWLENRMKSQASLINGNDVMNILGYAGPKIKETLDKAWIAQKNGEFTDKDSALEWLRSKII